MNVITLRGPRQCGKTQQLKRLCNLGDRTKWTLIYSHISTDARLLYEPMPLSWAKVGIVSYEYTYAVIGHKFQQAYFDEIPEEIFQKVLPSLSKDAIVVRTELVK